MFEDEWCPRHGSAGQDARTPTYIGREMERATHGLGSLAGPCPCAADAKGAKRAKRAT